MAAQAAQPEQEAQVVRPAQAQQEPQVGQLTQEAWQDLVPGQSNPHLTLREMLLLPAVPADKEEALAQAAPAAQAAP
jgi:hypothetical protein